MAVLDQYTYILAIGVLFAFLDGWNIGANDVANAFATSVSSRSLTLIQAMAIASVCEFGGAILAGYVNSVSDGGWDLSDVAVPALESHRPSRVILSRLSDSRPTPAFSCSACCAHWSDLPPT